MTPADPDGPCFHTVLDANVQVTRLTAGDGPTAGVVAYAAEIRVACGECGERFRWTGLPAGLDPTRPTCSPDERELRAPLRPESADPDFGLGLPGYAIGYRGA